MMIAINKAEKEALKMEFPALCVVRTMKQDSKRKHYYCEEDRRAMKYLAKIRSSGVFLGKR